MANPWDEYAASPEAVPVSANPWEEYGGPPTPATPVATPPIIYGQAADNAPASSMPPPVSFLDQLKQNLDITSPAAKAVGQTGVKSGVRGVATGLTGMLGLMADANQGAANIMTQTPHQMPSAALQQAMTGVLGPDQHPGATLATSLLFGASDPTMLALRSMLPATAASAFAPGMTPAEVKANTIRDWMQAGGKITPSQSPAAGVGSDMLSAVAGPLTLKQMGQQANYNLTQRLAAKMFNLPADTAITPENAKDAITKTYTDAYDPINKIPLLSLGKQYLQDLRNISGATPTSGSGAFNPAAEAANYARPFMGGAEAVDNIRQARELAHDAYTSNAVDKTLRGDTYRNIADALENAVGRQVGGQTLADMQAGRAQLAQQYALRRAIIPGSGGINPRAIGQQMASQVRTSGTSPFTGDLAMIGNMANTVPKAMTVPGDIPPTINGIDKGLLLGALHYFSNGETGKGIAAAAAAGGRIAARHGLMSGPYQRAFLQPSAATGPGIFGQLLDNPQVQNAMPTTLQGLFGPQQ